MTEPLAALARQGAAAHTAAAPRRVVVTILLASLCAASLAAPPDQTAPSLAPQADIVVRDDSGREVHLAASSQSAIVSLLPSLTETVCALNACARLVATDRYSDCPADVRSLPKAGGLDDAQIEEIVRLRPDVVLLSHSQRISRPAAASSACNPWRSIRRLSTTSRTPSP